MAKAAIGAIGLPQVLKIKGIKPQHNPLAGSSNPMRKTAKQRVGKAFAKKVSYKPTPIKVTQPASLRGVGLSVSGMKKLATGRAGRVVKATVARGKR